VAIGPLIDENGVAKAEEHVKDAVARGAQLLVGGERLAGSDFDRGTFFAPTVVDDVPLDARVMSEETFGPVAAVHEAADDRALLAATNAGPYGLAAYVYGEDLERAWAFAERVEAGAVGINVNDTTDLQAPFGGWKLSGLGRELGPEGLRAYLEPRHLRMRVRPLT
jgi:acyl-CoA reductase-like NAD-dependent aldehyde dehydrogenase